MSFNEGQFVSDIMPNLNFFNLIMIFYGPRQSVIHYIFLL
jgi:hypothetical protein